KAGGRAAARPHFGLDGDARAKRPDDIGDSAEVFYLSGGLICFNELNGCVYKVRHLWLFPLARGFWRHAFGACYGFRWFPPENKLGHRPLAGDDPAALAIGTQTISLIFGI